MNALDSLRWDQWLREEILVSPGLHRMAEEPRTEISNEFNERFTRVFAGLGLSPSSYGYGWFVSTTPGSRFAWHQGGWYEVQAAVMRDLDSPLTVGMFANTDEIPLRLLRELFEFADDFVDSERE